jgi:hypothetical protein
MSSQKVIINHLLMIHIILQKVLIHFHLLENLFNPLFLLLIVQPAKRKLSDFKGEIKLLKLLFIRIENPGKHLNLIMITNVKIPCNFLNLETSLQLASNPSIQIIQNLLVLLILSFKFLVQTNRIRTLIHPHLTNRNILLMMVELVMNVECDQPARRVPENHINIYIEFFLNWFWIQIETLGDSKFFVISELLSEHPN